MAAIEAQGIRADLIMLTHMMQAYAVRRDVEGAKVRKDRSVVCVDVSQAYCKHHATATTSTAITD